MHVHISPKAAPPKAASTTRFESVPSAADADPVSTIGDLAREYRVSLRTLRFYEDRGLLSPRREGLTRLYDAHDRARLGVILKGKRLGFTLAEIRAMVGSSAGPTAHLNLSAAKIDEQIAHLENQKLEIEQALDELRARRAPESAR